jgi:hypothetical protein
VKHFASPDFWRHYNSLPEEIKQLADKNFKLLETDPHHPSLRLKKVGTGWSARVGVNYRVLGKSHQNGIIWVWIGPHCEYDRFLS